MRTLVRLAIAAPWCVPLIPGAEAADLGIPAPSAASFVDWSGPYLAGQASGGASYGGFDLGAPRVGVRTVPDFRTGDGAGRNDAGRRATSAVGGLALGWGWQAGQTVIGLEADLSAASLKRPVLGTTPGFGYERRDGLDGLDIVRAKTGAYGTLRARLGYSFDRYLVYGSFGLAAADSHVLSTFPGQDGTAPDRGRREFGSVGFTLGAGIQFAILPNFALGIDYRYLDLGRTDRLGLGFVPGADGGPFSARVGAASNQVLARLYWFPGGLALPPEPDDAAPHDPDTGNSDRISVHGQTTLVAQGVPNFRSPYVGPQSLVPSQTQQTTTATVFLGLRLTDSTELYYNPEFSQGFGLSRTTGVAGFLNGEAQKAGAAAPRLRSNRYYVRQTFGLGGETETVPDGPNQLAGTRDVERVTVVAGKFALGDFFDGNAYAHDPRVDFFNWSLWASGAYDFPANLPGYTQGVMVEYNRSAFAVRGAYTQVPKEPSSDVLDPRVLRRGGATLEFEERHTLPLLHQPGKLRVGLFSNEGVTANYRDVVALTQAGTFADANEAAAATRRPRRKSGFYVNLEQALTADLGSFLRFSDGDGRTENLSFADIDRSLSGGLSLKGAGWGRAQDTVGVGAVMNALSPSHRAYLAAGGLGLVVGDGRLRYAAERAFEAYYAVGVSRAVTVTFDYQHVDSPGYNRDRGPVDAFATRLHVDF